MKFMALATVLALSPSFLVSQSFDSTREEVQSMTALSSIPFEAHASLLGLRNFSDSPPFSYSDGFSYLNEATALLMPLPMYSYDASKALFFSGAGIGLYSAASLFQALDGPVTPRNLLFTLSWKLNMESTYEIYRDLRANSVDPEYRDFRQYSFLDIAGSPFNIEAILNPVNLVVVPLYAVSMAAAHWEKAETQSVFATGKFYVENVDVGPFIGSSVLLATASLGAIQNSFEEAYWRGFLYEELKYSFKKANGSLNWLPASIVSSALFAAWHIPIQGFNWTIPSVFILGLIIDGAYETGGLPAAAAGHGLANAAAYIVTSLMLSGVPTAKEPKVASSNASPVSTYLSPEGMVISVSIPDLVGVRL